MMNIRNGFLPGASEVYDLHSLKLRVDVCSNFFGYSHYLMLLVILSLPQIPTRTSEVQALRRRVLNVIRILVSTLETKVFLGIYILGNTLLRSYSALSLR